MKLAQLQRLFAEQIPNPDVTVNANLLALLPVNRVQVYRGNFLGAQLRALENIYPIIRKILGAAYFGQLTRAFVLEHPHHKRDISGVGHDFSQWLIATIPQHTELADFRYLPDMAALELAHDQARFAADAPTFDFDAFQAALGTHGAQGIALLTAPSLHLLDLQWPVDQLWQQQRTAEPQEVTDETAPIRLAVMRQHTDVIHLRLDAVTYQLLHNAEAGSSLETLAGIAAQNQIPELISAGMISGFSLLPARQ